MRRIGLFVVGALLASSAAACGGGADAKSGAATLRLGYFANVTHAPAIVGVRKGFFTEKLGSVQLKTQTFNAGPAAIEALAAGSIDAAYIGPNPAINMFVRSKRAALRIVAGSTSGGAALVVRSDLPITSAADFRGRKVATPSLGNTQDVALRAWLADAGLKTDPLRGGDVTIVPTENATTLQLFQDKKLDAAWVPEPWASRLVLEGGGKVLVDERTLWPQGRFVTTHLIVATKYLERNPAVVTRMLEAHVQATQWIAANPAAAKTVVNDGLLELTQKKLQMPTLDRAFTQLEFTVDPVATSLAESAADAMKADLLEDADLKGIYDLRLLNQVLAAAGAPAVSDGGLGAGQ